MFRISSPLPAVFNMIYTNIVPSGRNCSDGTIIYTMIVFTRSALTLSAYLLLKLVYLTSSQ